MAEPETGKVNPNPEAAKPAAPGAQDATKYVGTPAVGTSKAAAAAGVAGTAPSTEIDRHRRRFVWTMVTGFLMAWFLAFFRFFLPRTLFEPNSVFKIGYPVRICAWASIPSFSRNTASGWTARRTGYFVIYARCTHLGCTPDWKPSENKFKCPCHGSGYDSEGINFEGPAPRPMDRATVEIAPDGQILVDVSKLYSVAQGTAQQVQRSGSVFAGV